MTNVVLCVWLSSLVILVLRMQWLDWGELMSDTSWAIGPDLYLKETRVIQTCVA
jgi:hypothetical protein